VAGQRALDTAQSELSEMCSEVLMAEAEAELAEAMLGAGVRGEWREATTLIARTKAAEQHVATAHDDRAALEELVPVLCEKVRESAEANEKQRLAVEALEGELGKRQESVVSYEARARELHRDLQHVLSELRASYEGAQREKRRLEEHVANLERRPAARTRSPRAVAALRAAAHLRGAPRLREPTPTESQGVPWWSPVQPERSKAAVEYELELEREKQREQREHAAAVVAQRGRTAATEVVEQPNAGPPPRLTTAPARASPSPAREKEYTCQDSGLMLDVQQADFANKPAEKLSPVMSSWGQQFRAKQEAPDLYSEPSTGSRDARATLSRQGHRQANKTGSRRRLKRSSSGLSSASAPTQDRSAAEDRGDADSDSSGYWENYAITEEAPSRCETPVEEARAVPTSTPLHHSPTYWEPK